MSYTDGLNLCIQWAVMMQFCVLFWSTERRSVELLRCSLCKVYIHLISLAVWRWFFLCIEIFLCAGFGMCVCMHSCVFTWCMSGGVCAREECQFSHSPPDFLAAGLSEAQARLVASMLKWPFCLCSRVAGGWGHRQAYTHGQPFTGFWGFELSTHAAISSSPSCSLYIIRLAKFNLFFVLNPRHLGK